MAAPLPDRLSEARRQLLQAIEARNSGSKRSYGSQPQALLADKQRLLEWLADLHQEKVKRLEELDVLQLSEKTPVEADPLVRTMQGPPPYSAVQVDALRDEIDGLEEKLAVAEASYRANQTELQNLNTQLKARSAVVRRASETPRGSRAAEEVEQAQGEYEIADLLAKIAKVEISVMALDQQRLSQEIAALRGRIKDMQVVAARVMPHQHLSEEDLAAQHQRVRREEESLAREIERVSRRDRQFRIEREMLGENGMVSSEQVTFLDQVLRTDNAILKGLDHLKILNDVSGNAWEKRYVLLTSSDSQQRNAALEAMKELRQKLADWRGLSRIRQDALKTEIRNQRIRVDNLSANPRAKVRERELLSLLLLQTETDERTELAATRLERQVSRWLGDLSGPGNVQFEGQMTWIVDGAASLATQIWQHELFVAEDISEVDGRQVSVKYGITVGKSIGIVVVFIMGYWVLARFSRLIQTQLVLRLKVSSQQASVIRRWSMIALSGALIIILLNLARIPLTVFAFLGGALAIGVGFGAQAIIKNLISGLIVLMERKVRVGDIVELGGVTGEVTAVDLRATTVRSFNGVEALIPNAIFIENQVVNWTYSNHQIRRELKLGIAYGTDVRQAESLFLAAATNHPQVLKQPSPEAFFEDFGDSALVVILVYWVELNGPVSPRRIDSDLRHDIYGRLGSAGITIPFPQREVQVTISQPLHVRMAGESSLGGCHGK